MKLLSWLRWCFNFDVMLMIVAIIGFFQVFNRRRNQSNSISQSLKDVMQEFSPVIENALKPNRVPLRKPPRQGVKRRFGKYEERCRQIFQEIFHKPFLKIRPDWLINPITGELLELDGYCPDIKTHLGQGLAFEYDGNQHSKYNKFFHKNVYQFAYQIKKDKIKNDICRERKILVIHIPSFVNYYELEDYIKKQLKKHHLCS